jgi:hypothetical protein
MAERMFAVAIRDGSELFLWLRLRRAPKDDIYCMIPTGRNDPELRKWDPHESLHKDGNLHRKSFDRKMFPKKERKPDASFAGVLNLLTRSAAKEEPRQFNVYAMRQNLMRFLSCP